MTGNLFTSDVQTTSAPTTEKPYIAHCDGGSRGNPGPSGYGAVIQDPTGKTVAQLSEFLGIQTNNYAEYSGMLAVLRWALEHSVERLKLVSDSELMVKQMKGQYKVSSPGLKPLWDEARLAAKRIRHFEIAHTLRAGNKEADQLANEAMDRGIKQAGGLPKAIKYLADQPVANPVLEGYVKGGVIHLLSGELPDGVFVKIVRK